MKEWTKPELSVLGTESTEGNSAGTTPDLNYHSGHTNMNNGCDS